MGWMGLVCAGGRGYRVGERSYGCQRAHALCVSCRVVSYRVVCGAWSVSETFCECAIMCRCCCHEPGRQSPPACMHGGEKERESGEVLFAFLTLLPETNDWTDGCMGVKADRRGGREGAERIGSVLSGGFSSFCFSPVFPPSFIFLKSSPPVVRSSSSACVLRVWVGRGAGACICHLSLEEYNRYRTYSDSLFCIVDHTIFCFVCGWMDLMELIAFDAFDRFGGWMCSFLFSRS